MKKICSALVCMSSIFYLHVKCEMFVFISTACQERVIKMPFSLPCISVLTYKGSKENPLNTFLKSKVFVLLKMILKNKQTNK